MTTGTDSFATHSNYGLEAPAYHATAVTPHNTNELAHYSRALYIGTGGDISVVAVGDDTAVTFANIPDGSTLPLRVKIVKSTGTDATDIVALW